MSTERRCTKNIKRKQRRFTIAILSTVKCLINQPERKKHYFCELEAMCNKSHDVRNSCLFALTETWLTDRVPDNCVDNHHHHNCVSLPGFGIPCRSDRSCNNADKSRGGGVCLYVNEGWCEKEKVTVKQRLSTPELDLISVSLRPRYLPREFGRVYVLVVYAPVFDTPSAIKDGKTIADAI